MLGFNGAELLAAIPIPKAGGPPLVGWLRLLIQYICNPMMRHAVVSRLWTKTAVMWKYQVPVLV